MRTDRKKIIIAATALLAAALWLVFSPRGWLRLKRAEREQDRVSARALRLERENLELRRKADCLDPRNPCFEDLARHEYGLARKDEIIITLPGRKARRGK